MIFFYPRREHHPFPLSLEGRYVAPASCGWRMRPGWRGRTAPRTGLLADLVRRSPVERQRRDIPGDPSEVEPIAGGA